MKTEWQKRYPVYWINLDRQPLRRQRMEWALESGGWSHFRWPAIDAKDTSINFLALARPLCKGNALPGLRRSEEANPQRRTSREELACLSSWQIMIEHLNLANSPSGWFLLMEDDVGSSLACPEAWHADLDQITAAAGPSALAIQLAPISCQARQKLHKRWQISQGHELLVPKRTIRSHGNGAVLLHQRAMPFLRRKVSQWLQQFNPHMHLLRHPWAVRPVADKWLYASLKAENIWVSTYPLFCLEAEDSDLHISHVSDFHAPSRDLTLKLWKLDGAQMLLDAFESWTTQTKII